ncbi:MAG: phage portal protein [Pseudolabrys sp.]
MFDGLRDRMAGGLLAVANRLTGDKYPGASRVASGARTLAGVVITPDTAVTISAVWACLRYLSQTVAVLPWHVMLDGKSGAEIKKSHPVDYLIWKRPNKEWSSFQFKETLTHWALRWGNGYAEIERDQLDRPFALWPSHPERVECCRATEDAISSSGRDIATGDLFYEVNNGTGEKIIIAAVDMFHLRGFGEGVLGVNVIDYASQSLGWARAIQLFGASAFGNGMNVAGVVINKKPLKPDGLKRQRAQFEQLYKGPRNANKTVFLDNDAEWKAIGMSPEKAQMIDASYLLIEEVCRWFGVPPHKVMHLLRATFSNIEHQAIEVVVDSVTPWVKRFEDEADFKLFGAQNRQGFYTKMNMRALLRGDFKSQNEGLEIMRRNGALNADDWRDYLDMNKMPAGDGGDKYVMQSQYTTLENIGETPTPTPSAASPSSASSGTASDPEETDDMPNDAAAHALVDSIAELLEPVA